MSEFNFKDKIKYSKYHDDFISFLKVVLFVGSFCALYGACNWSLSAIKERNQKIKDAKKQEKVAVDTTKAYNYLNNTHQIAIFQDTAKTK